MPESLEVKELTVARYRNEIRSIKRATIMRAAAIKTAAAATLTRLNVRPNTSQAVSGMPDGSNQGNIRSFIEWMDKLVRSDRAAIRQLVAIHATAVQRTEGWE